MRRYPDRVRAGELSDALGLKPSTLSAYLSALMQVGLVTQARAGTSLMYSLDMGEVRRTLDYLALDCCRGRPEACLSLAAGRDAGPLLERGRKYNVLFLCVGNSARSIFAETILRDMAGDRFNAYSAGTQPYSALNPFALKLLASKGHDIVALRAKNVAEFQGAQAPVMDFVFTVCDRAANEECPPWEGQPVTGHWGMPDPVGVEGTEAEKGLAFQRAYGTLARRIAAFTALPMRELDRLALQGAVDDIARQEAENDA